jgi:hypothetical protein
MGALPAQRSRSWAARAAADIQDTIAGRKLKIISPESAEALPHLTYQVFPSGSMLLWSGKWARGTVLGVQHG